MPGGRTRCTPQSHGSGRRCSAVAPGEVTRKIQGSRGEWHPGTQSKECGKKLVGVGHLEGESEG